MLIEPSNPQPTRRPPESPPASTRSQNTQGHHHPKYPHLSVVHVVKERARPGSSNNAGFGRAEGANYNDPSSTLQASSDAVRVTFAYDNRCAGPLSCMNSDTSQMTSTKAIALPAPDPAIALWLCPLDCSSDEPRALERNHYHRRKSSVQIVSARPRCDRAGSPVAQHCAGCSARRSASIPRRFS